MPRAKVAPPPAVDWTEDRVKWLKHARNRLKTNGKDEFHGEKSSFTRRGIWFGGVQRISFTNAGIVIVNNERPLFNYFVISALDFRKVRELVPGVTITWRVVLGE